MLLKRPLILAALAWMVISGTASFGQKSGCKAPELLSATVPSEEESARRAKIKPEGKILIRLNEAGDVTDASVVRASSTEAAEILLAHAKSMKFKPRPGCGTVSISINFSLGK